MRTKFLKEYSDQGIGRAVFSGEEMPEDVVMIGLRDPANDLGVAKGRGGWVFVRVGEAERGRGRGKGKIRIGHD